MTIQQYNKENLDKMGNIGDASQSNPSAHDDLARLTSPVRQFQEPISDWQNVKEILRKATELDYDIITPFGDAQLSIMEDDCIQIGLHGETAPVKIKGGYYNQERSSFYNINKEGQVISVSNHLSPYMIDSSGIGIEYITHIRNEDMRFTAQEVVSAILEALRKKDQAK